jgi:xanthine/CO dehydrogenase XdhC/CoxF family maturation factor
MGEGHEVSSALERAPAGGAAAVLATLVKVAGSAYSGPGARMVVLPDGTIAGTFGAGCFEQDLVAHAERIRTSGAPELVRYDLTEDDDKPWGLGMGCHGKLDLLLEPVPAGKAPEHLAFLREAAHARQAAIVATLFRTGGDASLTLGDRLLVRADGQAAGRLLTSQWAAPLFEAARAALAERRSRFFVARAGDGEAEALLEFAAPPIALVVGGAGRDTDPLARLARELGWEVKVLGKDEMPPALDERTAALVMSHNYERDLAMLATFLQSPSPYVGVLGGQVRTRQILSDLAKRGTPATRSQLARLHAPVGLDLGAETPSEVALSIVAEIQAVFADRRGGALSERKGPIHDRP